LLFLVIPAHAGIQGIVKKLWILACARMTGRAMPFICSASRYFVIPAHAGIQEILIQPAYSLLVIPAHAGI
jgi:hypothetical protein